MALTLALSQPRFTRVRPSLTHTLPSTPRRLLFIHRFFIPPTKCPPYLLSSSHRQQNQNQIVPRFESLPLPKWLEKRIQCTLHNRQRPSPPPPPCRIGAKPTTFHHVLVQWWPRASDQNVELTESPVFSQSSSGGRFRDPLCSPATWSLQFLLHLHSASQPLQLPIIFPRFTKGARVCEREDDGRFKNILSAAAAPRIRLSHMTRALPDYEQCATNRGV